MWEIFHKLYLWQYPLATQRWCKNKDYTIWALSLVYFSRVMGLVPVILTVVHLWRRIYNSIVVYVWIILYLLTLLLFFLPVILCVILRILVSGASNNVTPVAPPSDYPPHSTCMTHYFTLCGHLSCIWCLLQVKLVAWSLSPCDSIYMIFSFLPKIMSRRVS